LVIALDIALTFVIALAITLTIVIALAIGKILLEGARLEPTPVGFMEALFTHSAIRSSDEGFSFGLICYLYAIFIVF
jgi:hypothetical protein